MRKVADVMIIILFLMGCGNHSPKEELQLSFLSIEDKAEGLDIDIPVSVNVSNLSNYLGFKIKAESDNNIYIDATSIDYDKYISGKRLIAPLEVFGIDYYMNYLTVDVDIVNNSTSRIDVEELDVNVESSKLDSLPFVRILTAVNQTNSISFVNDSWFNWGGFTFSYSIMKRGQRFEGKYLQKRHIDFFRIDTTIDLLQDLLKTGYNFENLCREMDINRGDEFDTNEFFKRCSKPYSFKDNYMDYSENEYDSYDYEYTNDDYEYNRYSLICYTTNDKNSDIFDPFEIKECDLYEGEYEGFARLYGKLMFDIDGYEVEFVANVSLCTYCGFGAGSYVDDHFDVALKTTGKNYILRYPYTTVIEPYGAERVSLIIKANKSSNHNFYFSLKNSNGLNIRSKNVKVHYLVPRSYSINNGRK